LTILSVDPGEHNGYALVNYTGKKEFIVEKFGVMERPFFYRWLVSNDFPSDIDLFLVEDFKTRPNEAKRGVFDWNQMIAPKVIGALELVSVWREIPLILQQPSIKPVGYGYLGKTYKKGAGNVHHWDAVAHAMYYLVTKRLVVPNSAKIG